MWGQVIVVRTSHRQVCMRLIDILNWRVVHVCFHAVGFTPDALHFRIHDADERLVPLLAIPPTFSLEVVRE